MELSPKNYQRLWLVSECLKRTANIRIIYRLFKQAKQAYNLMGATERLDYQTLDLIHSTNGDRLYQRAYSLGFESGFSLDFILKILSIAWGGKNA